MELEATITTITDTTHTSDVTRTTGPAVTADRAGAAHDAGITVLMVEEELLVEEISIDGMCGVY